MNKEEFMQVSNLTEGFKKVIDEKLIKAKSQWLSEYTLVSFNRDMKVLIKDLSGFPNFQNNPIFTILSRIYGDLLIVPKDSRGEDDLYLVAEPSYRNWCNSNEVRIVEIVNRVFQQEVQNWLVNNEIKPITYLFDVFSKETFVDNIPKYESIIWKCLTRMGWDVKICSFECNEVYGEKSGKFTIHVA